MNHLQQALSQLVDGHDLNAQHMTQVMQAIMQGQATDAQIGAILTALRIKGETVEEITAAAQVMRELATPVQVSMDHLVDTCGTGGDAHHTFNVSTASAFVVAASGARVAKHGNRSVSSRSGSADVLEAAGLKLDQTPEQVADSITEHGLGFLFAPAHHGAMKHAIGPRREMGIRTLFNILGPLTNPASAPNQVLGVYQRDLVLPLAQVLQSLGSRHAMVVHAEDGLDEISISAATHVAELKAGQIRQYTIEPEDFGLTRSSLSDIQVDTVEASLAMLQAALQPASDVPAAKAIIALNAGAAIYVAGRQPSLADGVQTAQKLIANGAAWRTLQAVVHS